MKISISIGTDAKEAFETAIEGSVVEGISLEGHTLTFDYEGLDNNGALQRATDNLKALEEKSVEAGNAGDKVLALRFGYAVGFMAVGISNLAFEQQGSAAGALQQKTVAEFEAEKASEDPPRKGAKKTAPVVTQEADATEA